MALPQPTPSSVTGIAIVLLVLASAAAHGQSAPAVAQVPAPNRAASDPAVQLSVFEVTAEKDLGYAASTALTGTRTSEKLANLPNSISVMTQEFLQDIAVNNFLDAVEFATNAENVYNDSGTRGAAIGARSGNQISFRGFAAIRQLRDGFPWYMPQDVYNTERIELSRGPGGLAFGDVDPGGIINISTKRANWRRAASAQVRYDTFGTRRYSIDLNQPLLDQRVAVRFNAIDADNDSARQRAGTALRGYAGAVRVEPFKDRRTVIDATYEHGNHSEGFSHVVLNDQTSAYVRGSGTNALDANPNLAGVQNNGVGMVRSAVSTGALHFWNYIDGTIYNLQSSATNVFRNSTVTTGAAVATGADPQNPNRLPIVGIPESIVPRFQDWGGPDNGLNSKFHAYTIELKHKLSEQVSLLVGYNGQKDDTRRVNVTNGAQGFGQNVRSIFIDTNPNLPDPSDPTRTRLIRNPRFEQYFIPHNPVTIIDGHDMRNWRGQIVIDPKLPWGLRQRLVLAGSYRHETYYKDNFTRVLAPEEIARRGYTGAAAQYPNNRFYHIHYLSDGNSDEALRNRLIPGVTTDVRMQDGGGADQRFDQSLTSGSISLLGSCFGERVFTSVGLSRDRWIQSALNPARADPVTGEFKFVDAAGNLIPNAGMAKVAVPVFPFSSQWVTNQTYGAVWHALRWVSLSAGYFESALFSDNYGRDLNGGPLSPKTGEGHDFSLRLHPWGERVAVNVTYFSTVSENNSANVSAAVRDELNPFLAKPFANVVDYRDRTSTGYEVEIVTNFTRAWTLRGNYGRNETINTRFFPLLQEKITEARATATAQRLNPDDATANARDFLASQESAATSTIRSTAAVTTRYSFTQGGMKGFALGGSVRYVQGKDRAAVSVGGVEVLPETKTENYYVVSPFITYRRKIGRTTWTAQVNVNNLFDKVSDQGTAWRYPRWTDPRQIITTVSLSY